MTRPLDSSGLDAGFRVPRRHFAIEALIHLEPGQRMAIFGTSGAGKTTILEAIAGEVKLESGEIWLDGLLTNCSRRRGRRSAVPVPPRERGIAAVRQPTTLFPHLTVFDNVTYGIRKQPPSAEWPAGRAAAERTAAGPSAERPAGPTAIQLADDLLDRVGLGGFARARPQQLSGGQRQRVAIARALARPFRALLLDEPFSAVDVPSRRVLREATIDTSAAQGAVAMLVTHDLAEAQAFGHTIAVVDAGRILQTGQAAVIARRPESRRAAELLGYTTFVPSPDGGSWALHPDRFLVGRHEGAGPVFAGVVRACRPAGTRFACELECTGVEESPRRDGCESILTLRIEVRVEVAPSLGTELVVTADVPPNVTSFPGGGQEGGRSSV